MPAIFTWEIVCVCVCVCVCVSMYVYVCMHACTLASTL